MMKKQYTIEALLRPPVEWYSSGVMIGVSGLLLLSPDTFFLSSGFRWPVLVMLWGLAGWRFAQGWQVVAYQRRLRCLPRWALRSARVPLQAGQLFLGKGFRWTATHTQRLHELTLPQHAHYRLPPKWYRVLRALETKWQNGPVLKTLFKLTASEHQLNPFRPYPPVGGLAALHAVSSTEKHLYLPMSDRVGHTLVLGTTRVGKTRLAELLISQDIRRGEAVIVFDPKGDTDLLKRIQSDAKLAGREADVQVFHLGFPDTSCRYNPIGSFVRVTEVGNRIANQLPGSGDSAAFKSFGWRFVNLIAQVLVAQGVRPNYRLIAKHLLTIDDLVLQYCEYRLPQLDDNWQARVERFEQQLRLTKMAEHQSEKTLHLLAIARYIEQYASDDSLLQGLASTLRYDRSYFDKITASLLPLLDKLTSGHCAELLSPDYADLTDKRPILDWLKAIRNRQIVYVGLDALTDTTIASAVGNSMFADLVSVAGRLYNHGVNHGFYPLAGKPVKEQTVINVHADEFAELMGDEFIPLVNKGGGSGMRVTAYSQTLSDIEARLGNASKAGQVVGNFNNVILFRVKEARTAELLIQQLPKVQVHSLMAVSSASDTPDNVEGIHFHSSNEDRITTVEAPMLTHSDISMLPKGHAFCLMQGGQLYKLRVPLPK